MVGFAQLTRFRAGCRSGLRATWLPKLTQLSHVARAPNEMNPDRARFRKFWLIFLLVAISPASVYLFTKVVMDLCYSCASAVSHSISEYGLDWFWLNKAIDLGSLGSADSNSANSYSVAMAFGFYMSLAAPFLAFFFVLHLEDATRQRPEARELVRAFLFGLIFLAIVFYLQFGLGSSGLPGRWRLFLAPSQSLGLVFSSIVEGFYFFSTVFIATSLLVIGRDLWKTIRGI